MQGFHMEATWFVLAAYTCWRHRPARDGVGLITFRGNYICRSKQNAQ